MIRRGSISAELALGAGIAGVIALLIVVQPILPLAPPLVGDLADRFAAPGASHLLGADNLGRDLLSRVLAGGAWSLGVGLTVTTAACLIGALFGLIAAQQDGVVRAIVSWLVDATLSFPNFVLAVIIVAVLGHGFLPMSLTLALVLWPAFARVTLVESLAILKSDYVAAARLLGRSDWSILIGHVAPALAPSLSVMFPFVFAEVLVAESGLSFLGLGAPLGAPSWGNMLQEARDFLLIAPWMMAAPAGGIILATIAANLIGDGVRKLTASSATGTSH